jgi:hypothetical protein
MELKRNPVEVVETSATIVDPNIPTVKLEMYPGAKCNLTGMPTTLIEGQYVRFEMGGRLDGKISYRSEVFGFPDKVTNIPIKDRQLVEFLVTPSGSAIPTIQCSFDVDPVATLGPKVPVRTIEGR